MKLFITGTDTGIGKTWVSAAIAWMGLEARRSVIYYKPVQTGSPKHQPPEDPAFVEKVLENRVRTVNRYCFEPPVAPLVADTHGVIDLAVIAQDVAELETQCDLLLIEGAGGLAVPLTANHLMIDLIESLQAPVLLVAHSRLGTINHTLLSVEALIKRGIPLFGIVINFYPADISKSEMAVATLEKTLRQFLAEDIPLWHCIEQQTPGLTPLSASIRIPPEAFFGCYSL